MMRFLKISQYNSPWQTETIRKPDTLNKCRKIILLNLTFIPHKDSQPTRTRGQIPQFDQGHLELISYLMGKYWILSSRLRNKTKMSALIVSIRHCTRGKEKI